MTCVLKDFLDGWNAWSKGKKSFNGPSPFCIVMPKQGGHAKITQSCQNRGVFISSEMYKMSLCHNSHGHAKFSHDCAKLKMIVVKMNPLEHFAWLCEIHLKDCSKMSHLDHFTHSCEVFAWLCETNVDDYNSFKPQIHFASTCEFSHDYAKIMLKTIIR